MSWSRAFDYLWLGWFAYFLAVEIPAAWLSYHQSPGGTLSEHLWGFLGIGNVDRMPRWLPVRADRLAFLAFSAWLLVHLLTGGWV